MIVQQLELEEITDNAAFEALRPEWSALWERCPYATPFQSPEWLLPWWKYFGNGRPFALALRCEGHLAGIAPFFIFTHEEGENRVALMGSGISDYLDIILEPGLAAPGTGMIFEHLLSERSRWDLCDFQELRRESPLLAAVPPPGLCAERSVMEVCPLLELPETVAAFRSRLTARSRKRLRKTANGLRQRGEITTGHATAATLSVFLDALFRLHRAVWEQRGQSGVLADPRLAEFHREVAAGFLGLGWLRLRVLRLEEKIIAALYSFAARGRLYCYLSGFDPGTAPLSPGKFILWGAIEEAIDEGIREVDFLRGREEYKYLWGPSDRPNFRLIIKKNK
ncbi:MAG: GNAT family N-acetyltransferase [Nitrospirota bacterium]